MLYIYDAGTSLIRRENMGELFDEYIDQYQLSGGAYGISMNFRRSSPKPSAPGSSPEFIEIGTVRMSLEHFKIMAFLMKRQIDDIERQFGIEIPIPIQVMNGLKISPDDWSEFWKRG
jgi:hypothetical protein